MVPKHTLEQCAAQYFYNFAESLTFLEDNAHAIRDMKHIFTLIREAVFDSMQDSM